MQEGTKAKGGFEHKAVKEIIWKTFFPGTRGDHHLSTSPWVESTVFRNVSLSDLQQQVNGTVSHVDKYCVETHGITEESVQTQEIMRT